MISSEFLRFDFQDVTLVSTFTRLFLAAVFRGAVGMEQGRKRRAAGLRTHMLVCLGATLVMITNQYISSEFGLGDPSRLGAQVISGIGFLGVGTIIVDRQQQVRGLTTAAGAIIAPYLFFPQLLFLTNWSIELSVNPRLWEHTLNFLVIVILIIFSILFFRTALK